MRNTLSAAFCSGSALSEMGKGQRGKSCSVISQARQLGKVVRQMLNKEMLERLRREYPVDCRAELLQMYDVTALPVGTVGIVTGIDDTSSIMVDWDNGSGLNCLYGIDRVRKVD